MIFVFLGCANSPIVEPPETPISHEYEVIESVSALDISAMEEEVNEAIAQMRDHHSREIVDSYYEGMGYADDQCPTAYEVDGNAFWYGYCYSELGLSFDGYLFFNAYEETDLFSDGTLWDAEVVNGSSTLHHDSLGKSNYSGNAYLAQGINPQGADVFLSVTQGSFLVEAADDVFLQEGWSPWLTLYGFRQQTPLGSGKALSISGSLPYSGEHVGALSFSNMVTFNSLFGHPCPQEPIGTMSVRSSNGVWLDVEFDVTQDWQLIGECDGCGMATTQFGDTYEFCVDLEPLILWEETPW